jgi:DNA-directed RNA polymerase subunit beta
MRGFGDAAAMRKNVFDNALAAAQGIQPVTNTRHTLRVRDVHYADPDHFSLKRQKQAILGGETLGRRLRGTWELTDNATGMTLDSKKATLASIPYFSNRGTVIHRGNEYTMANQFRLRPGVFTRKKANGEIESHANILPGKGPSHRYFLDPQKGTFHIQLQQAKVPLIPLMRALGATNSQLREAWGPEIYAANLAKDDDRGTDRLYQRLLRGRAQKGASGAEKQQAIREAYARMEVDPEVTTKTLGRGYNQLNLDSLLDTTRKLVAVSRGEEDVDDRDNLAFQRLVGPEDLISERLTRDAGGARRSLLFQASREGNLRSIGAGALNKQVESALLFSGLGQALEEINPSDIFDKQTRATRLGEGGIPSTDAIPKEARSVQPSQMGFVDPVRTPESLRAGVDVFLSRGARKGRDGRLYSQFHSPKTGELVWRSPQDLADLTIAFPGELKKGEKRVAAMRRGKMTYVRNDEVDLELPTFENAFSPLGNMIPLKSAMKGQRLAMASRMLTQALPLVAPEAPLVQSGIPGQDRSFEDEYASQMGAVRASQGGKVLTSDKDSMKVRYDDGQVEEIDLYNSMPYNRKTFLTNTATMGAGDRFRPGQLLASSNYTDRDGITALGLNARVAYLPARKGATFEDAIAISESFAQRGTSEQMYQHDVDWSDKTSMKGKGDYVSLYPKKFTKEILDKLDDDGVIQEGQVVNYGEPLVVLAKKREQLANRVHRKRDPGYTDQSETWKHHEPGIVTDVVKTKKGPVVVVKSRSQLHVGDKLSGRYGDKGVIGRIIADDKMPSGADGKPVEILLNPLGVISRTNPAQILEAALGKIAARTGKPYRVQDFEDIGDLREYVEKELSRHGLSDTEDLLDPETKRKIKGITTGNRFFMKLHHMAESKGQGRGTEGGYTAQGEPAKGGEAGSKRVSMMDTNALLSHGATANLRDVATVKGQRNEDLWLAFMQGNTPPNPKIPMTYDKFLSDLKSSGINVVSQGGKLNIMALTNRDVDALSGTREITSSDTVKFDDNLSAIKGGLFDPTLTGGHNGDRWSHIRLNEPMPNPVMEEPIRRLLGLTKPQFEAVMSGKEKIGQSSGPGAIQDALQRINVPREILKARAQIASGKKTHRDTAIRKLRYLQGAKDLGIHPRDWMLDKVPVMPPRFRPISIMGDKRVPLVSDANYLYREVMEANDNLKSMGELSDDIGEERLALYNSFKAVTGLGDPVHPKLVEKNVKGVLKHIFGSSPKYGTVQRRLLSSTVDMVGRAVITPDSDLDMDSVGLPETKAWDVYRNFVIRRLKRRGMSSMQTVQAVREQTPLARKELELEMQNRPVIVNRAPVLHRFGIMAFRPQLVKDDTLHISPLVVNGFGADFDGDAVQYHVPVSEDAVKEARERLLPSRNLLSPADFKSPVHSISKEFAGGLHHASTAKSRRRTKTFRRLADVIAAHNRGEISMDDEVEIMERRGKS